MKHERERSKRREPCFGCGQKTLYLSHVEMGHHVSVFRYCQTCHKDFDVVLTKRGTIFRRKP